MRSKMDGAGGARAIVGAIVLSLVLPAAAAAKAPAKRGKAAATDAAAIARRLVGTWTFDRPAYVMPPEQKKVPQEQQALMIQMLELLFAELEFTTTTLRIGVAVEGQASATPVPYEIEQIRGRSFVLVLHERGPESREEVPCELQGERLWFGAKSERVPLKRKPREAPAAVLSEADRFRALGRLEGAWRLDPASIRTAEAYRKASAAERKVLDDQARAMQMTLTFSGGNVRMEALVDGAKQQQQARLTVLAVDGDRIEIATVDARGKREEVVCDIRGERLILEGGSTPFTFVRQRAAGGAPSKP